MAPFIPSVPIPTPLLPHPLPIQIKTFVWHMSSRVVPRWGICHQRSAWGWGRSSTYSLEVLAEHFPNCTPAPVHGLFSATPLYKIFCNVSARSRFKSASVSRSKDLAQSVNAEWSSTRKVPSLIASIPCFDVFPFRLVLISLKYR